MDPLEQIAQLRAAVEDDPTDADLHFELGCALRDLEDYAAAIPYAERACDLRPDFAEAAKLVALCRHLAGDVEAAWPWYERALGGCEPDPVLYYNAGVASDLLMQADRAIALYRHALEVRPDYSEALNNLGIALATAGRYDDAAEVYRTLLELRGAPDRHMAHCNLGLVYHYLGRLDDAIESFRAAIALEPSFSVAYCNLGNAYYGKGWTERATEMYRLAIEHDPNNVLAYNALGSFGEETAPVSKAVVSEYENYLDIHPWSALVYYNLGVALAARGNSAEALAQFDKALLMEPRFREARQAKEAMERGLESADDGD